MADDDQASALKESHSHSPVHASNPLPPSPDDPTHAAMAEFHLTIEVGSDHDSTFGGSDEHSSTTTSLASSIFDYVYEVSPDAPIFPPPGLECLPAPN